MTDSAKQDMRLGQRAKLFVLSIVSRATLAEKLGQTYGGARDVYTVLGYKKALIFQDYLDIYNRTHIAGRIVAAFPQATWSHRPTIKIIEGPAKIFHTSWRELNRNLKINAALNRVDRISGIGRFGILLIGVKDGRKILDPIGKRLSTDDILFLSPYQENSITIDKLETNPTNSRFGLPELYKIETAPPTPNGQRVSMRVHHSRVLHIAENLDENEVYGTPRLEGVYNLFDDLTKVVGGSAEFFWRIADRGIQFDIDPDLEMDSDDEAALTDEIDEYIHGLKRAIKTRGVTAKVLGSDTADPRGPYVPLIALISGYSGIPQRILTGSERGQLASSQDRASWNERIEERQRVYAEPCILRPLIDLFISIGVLPEVEYEVEWPALLPQTEDERSVNAARVSNAVLNVAKQRQVGDVVITPGEFREKYLGMEPTSPELEKEEAEMEKEKEANKKQMEMAFGDEDAKTDDQKKKKAERKAS